MDTAHLVNFIESDNKKKKKKRKKQKSEDLEDIIDGPPQFFDGTAQNLDPQTYDVLEGVLPVKSYNNFIEEGSDSELESDLCSVRESLSTLGSERWVRRPNLRPEWARSLEHI